MSKKPLQHSKYIWCFGKITEKCVFLQQFLAAEWRVDGNACLHYLVSLTFHKPSDLYVIVLSFVVCFFPPSVFLPLPSVLCRTPLPPIFSNFYHASPVSLKSGLALKPMLRFRVTLLIRIQLKLDMAHLGLFACLSIALSVCAFNTENNLFVHWPTELVPLLWSYQPTRYLV